MAGALAAAGQWPVPHAAVGALWAKSPPEPRGAEVFGEHDRVQPWASVTKVLVALAVLVAVEEGTVELTSPAGPPGATVAHLLAHASGLGPDGGVLAPPGQRRIYSNAGFEVLAETVAAAADMAFADYLAEGVLQPLGMTATELVAGASPASGARGTLDDLLLLAGELLDPHVVAPQTVASATGVAFEGLAGVLPGIGRFDPCDWGLGFERRGGKDPHWTGRTNSAATFGHFGRSGSFVWVDPVAGCAAAALTGRDFGPWALACWPTWSDGLLAALDAGQR